MSILSDFVKFGYIPSPTLLLGILSHKAALVLGHIIVSLNHAQKHSLCFKNDFLFDINRALSVLKFDLDDLQQAIEELSEAEIIADFESFIDGCLYIRVYVNKIIQILLEEKENRCMGSWDDGLLYSLNPISNRLNFTDSTLEIKKFLDGHLKSADTIPLIYYSYLNDFVIEYEDVFGKLADSFPIYEILHKNVCCVPVDTARVNFSEISEKIHYLSIEDKEAKELHTPVIDEIPPDDFL